ncbi:MAG: 3-deoxy-D-manno-octulosonic acid transferase [Terracidiphilus sp.]
MALFFYNLALFVALVAGAPWWLWRMATTNKYREGLGERLGYVRGGLLRQVAGEEGGRSSGRPVIWLHAVSVGEVLAVGRLATELNRALPEFQILISTTTRTGQALARERFGRDRVFYCPLDVPWAVRAYLNALRPRMLILAETEFWPNLLHGCFRRGIPVVVVNARISDRSWPRYRRLRGLWRPMLARLKRVLAQSATDAERLRAIGCAAERVTAAGNLKFDIRAADESEATRQMKARAQGLRIVVAGSTLEDEEAALLEIWPRLLEADSQLAMVIAPRHPERFNTVAGLIEKSGMSWVRRSEWRGEPASARQIAPGEIVLLDSIGELASMYSLAAVAFVGGSLVPAGGHNPLEPAQFGVPIVMGPHYTNFRTMVDELAAHNAVRIAAKVDLATALLQLLNDRASAHAMGERAREVFAKQAGATGRCVSALKEVLGAVEARPKASHKADREQPA